VVVRVLVRVVVAMPWRGRLARVVRSMGLISGGRQIVSVFVRVFMTVSMSVPVFMRMVVPMEWRRRLGVLWRFGPWNAQRGRDARATGNHHMEFRPADPATPNGLAGDGELVKPQPRKQRLKLNKVSPGVEKGADNHIAGRPGETIKIRYVRHVTSLPAEGFRTTTTPTHSTPAEHHHTRPTASNTRARKVF